jgi:hypothetical protein
MSRGPKIDSKHALQAYQLFVAALVRSIDHIHDVEVQAQLRALGKDARVAHGLPANPTDVERTLENFIATVDEFVDDGGNVDELKAALRQRARIREGEH